MQKIVCCLYLRLLRETSFVKYNNMKLLLFFCIVLHFITGLSAQNIKVIEPEIGSITDISSSAAKKIEEEKKIYKTTDSVISTFPSYEEAKVFLSQKQIEIWENVELYSKTDIFDISKVGCSWYCNGIIKSIVASSTLKSYKDISYDADNVHDFSLRSAWVEGVLGDGLGESITFTFEAKTPKISTIEIYNGYLKSEKLWKENSRVADLNLYINGKFYAVLKLKDTNAKQIFSIEYDANDDSELVFKFEIRSVYKGDKYEDTCLSEIEFNGDNHH